MRILKISLLIAGLVSTLNWSNAQEQKNEFKNQKQSSVHWGKVPVDSFLSFKEWKEDSDLKDLYPAWQKILTERNLREKVGNVFQCVGICRVDRGESFFNASHRTSVYEGDEFQTIGESYAWIFLLDGTMVRLSPHSSITFNEINIGLEQIYLNARFNAGNILWLSRSESSFEESDVRETEVLFFPFKLYEAMPVTEKKIYDERDLFDMIEEKKTRVNQYKTLNEAIAKNNLLTAKKPTFSFLVMPNATVMGTAVSLEALTLIGGKTYLKNRGSKFLGLNETVEPDTQLQLRGYDNKDLKAMSADTWFMVDEKGRTLGLQEDINWLTMGEFITRKIPSIMLAREIMLQEYSPFLFDTKSTPLILAKVHGYRHWTKDELAARTEFLKEYFRRVETSNLLTSSNFRQRLVNRGDIEGAKEQVMEFGTHFFIKALNAYYSYEDDPIAKEYNPAKDELNSTQKLIWKKMNGIR